ncbi:MAG: methyltransferase domain-containing protein [Chitinophagaceae bacterium]
MDRNEKVLFKVDKSGIGLEIGPSHAPFAPKKEGYFVHIIDHMTRDELKQKYTGHNVQLDAIEDVDFVWKGESYTKLTGKAKYYDWIIASHLVEHTPDFIKFLKECEEILKDDGVLSLVVPDIRFHFDYFRPITALSKVIDAYFQKNIIHSPGTAAEYYLNCSVRGGKIAWEYGNTEDFALLYSVSESYENMQKVIHEKKYQDIHSWSFTPTSFRLLIQDLNDLGFISLKETIFFPTSGCEFFITLAKNGAGFSQNRLDSLKTIRAELSL